MQYAHWTLDSRPRPGSLAPDAQSLVSRGQIHHQRIIDDTTSIEVGTMTETIRDFAEHRRVDHITAKNDFWSKNVREEYQAAGYYPIEVSFLWQWGEIHEWCHDHIGRDHYSWTGSTFWFETEKAAMWFALRWAQ